MHHLGHEVFCCLFLDNRHRVLGFDELFRGTIDGTTVYPREVVKEALARRASRNPAKPMSASRAG